VKSFEDLEILRAAVCIVGADGEVDEKENAFFEKLAKKIGVGLASRTAMINRAKSDPDFHQQMFQVLKTEPGESITILFKAAMADGQLDEKEILMLKSFSEKLGINEKSFLEVLNQAKSMMR
jgi:uncharacterized tellurite resistance protein B-like protein